MYAQQPRGIERGSWSNTSTRYILSHPKVGAYLRVGAHLLLTRFGIYEQARIYYLLVLGNVYSFVDVADVSVYVRMHVCMYTHMYACMHSCMDGWVDGWMDGWTDG